MDRPPRRGAVEVVRRLRATRPRRPGSRALRRFADERRAHRRSTGRRVRLPSGRRRADRTAPHERRRMGRHRRDRAAPRRGGGDCWRSPRAAPGSWTRTRAACASSSIGPTPGRPYCARCRPSRARATCCATREASDDGAYPGFHACRRHRRDVRAPLGGRAGQVAVDLARGPRAIPSPSIAFASCSASTRRACRGPASAAATRSRGRRCTTCSRRARTASASFRCERAAPAGRVDPAAAPPPGHAHRDADRAGASPGHDRRDRRRRASRRRVPCPSCARSRRTARTTRGPSWRRRGCSASTRTPRQSRTSRPGGEMTNDAYWAKFLQRRFVDAPARRCAATIASTARSALMASRSTRRRSDEAGEAARGHRGRRSAARRAAALAEQPAAHRGAQRLGRLGLRRRDRARSAHPRRWHWDPLREARGGGMGQLAPAVRQRVAPFMGFCGGAQMLATARGKARRGLGTRGRSPHHRPRPPPDERAPHPRLRAAHRRRARMARRPAPAAGEDPVRGERPAVRGPLGDPAALDHTGSARVALGRRARRRVPAGGAAPALRGLATSAFCGPDVVAASPRDGVFPNPSGPGWCDTVPGGVPLEATAPGPSSQRSSTPSRRTSPRRGPAIRPSRSPTRASSSPRRTKRWSTPT